ncbi:uncharacterized mitochondrial protein-like protein [Tanacetum coccineum]
MLLRIWEGCFTQLGTEQTRVAAVTDAALIEDGQHLLPGVKDLGGAIVDFQGGNYKISKPIVIPHNSGIEFLRNDTGLAMTQTKYALELLECADLLNVKSAATPMDLIVKLNETDGYLLHDPSTYKTLVGKLLYLTITRPDLSFAPQALRLILSQSKIISF